MTEAVSESVIEILNKATSASNHVLKMTGLEDQFRAAADSLLDYPINSVLLVAHFTSVILKIRVSEGVSFACSNPFGSILSCTLLCFAGSIIQNMILGIPLVKPLENSDRIVMLVLIWYFVFFCPLDIFTRLIMFIPVRVVLVIIKEVHRIKCMLIGIKVASSLFPNAWVIIIAAGSIRGCGSMVFKPFVHQIVGLGAARIELHRPSFTTKMSILISCVMSLQVKGILNVNLSSISFISTVLMAVFQLLFLFTNQTDPFKPLEDTLCAVFFRHPDQTATTSPNERKKKSD